MPVRKRGDRWHIRLQVGGQRIERSLGSAATKADALAYEGKIRADILAGRLGTTPDHSLDDALLRWLEGEASRLKSHNTIRSQIRAISTHSAGKSLAGIVSVAQKIKDTGIKDGLNVATINRRLALLRRVANLAYAEWDWLKEPLGKKIKLIPGETARHTYLTPAQVEHLTDCCEHLTVKTAIKLAARTGLRENEILKADTIFDGCILVTPETAKNKRPRLVPVPVDMLDLALPLGINYATLRKYFEAARIKAEMPQVRFHDLRHTAASWWAQAGANMAVLKELLGHSNMAVTSRYAHLSTADLKRVSADVARGKNGAETAETKL